MGIAAVPSYIGKIPDSISPGLAFEVFFQVWEKGTWEIEKPKRDDKSSGKLGAINKVLRFGKESNELLGCLRLREDRMAMVKGENVLSIMTRSISPFTTGLGMEHPLENGFAFLKPYGLPYLPGSSVKGVIRKAAEDLALGVYGENKGWTPLAVWWLFGFEAGCAYLTEPHSQNDRNEAQKPDVLAEKAREFHEAYQSWVEKVNLADIEEELSPFINWACEDEKSKMSYRSDPKLFLRDLASHKGKSLRDNFHNRGALLFWDVIPYLKADTLAVEILNPHYGEYYEGKTPPSDSGTPVPNFFITVPPESGFAFYIQCETDLLPKTLKPDRWKTLLKGAFRHSFNYLGFGAKTSIGYGRLDLDEKAQKAMEETRQCEEEQRKRDAAEEMIRKEAERRKAEFDAMSPEERDIALIRSGKLSEEKVVAIYNRIDGFPQDGKIALAMALKDYWMKSDKWEGKQSDKQKKKVAKVKEIIEGK